MPWNEPGDDNDKDNSKKSDPWKGKKSSQQGPPDLDVMLRNLGRKFKAAFGGGKGSNVFNNGGGGASFVSLRGIGLAILVLFIVWVLSGIFIVGPADKAVILRFGRYVETVGPGPHWIPRFVSSKRILNVQKINTSDYQAETLTRDTYMVNVKLTVQYRIGNPELYLFNVTDPITTLRQATASAVRQVVGRIPLDFVLPVENIDLESRLPMPGQLATTKKQPAKAKESGVASDKAVAEANKLHDKMRDNIAKTLKAIMTKYNTGIVITDVNLQHIKPPQEGKVSEAYDDANSAREDEKRIVNQAQAYGADIIPKAMGKAARIKQIALADRDKIILAAQGDVAAYNAILPEYKKAPVVTRERLYISALESVLDHSSKILVDTKGSNVLYLPLDQLIKRSQQGQSKLQSLKLPNESQVSSMVNASNNTTQQASNSSPSNYLRDNLRQVRSRETTRGGR